MEHKNEEEAYEFGKDPKYAYSTAWKDKDKSAARTTHNITGAPIKPIPARPPVATDPAPLTRRALPQKPQPSTALPTHLPSPLGEGPGVRPNLREAKLEGQNESPAQNQPRTHEGSKIVHIQALHHIYTTTDYTLFETITGNRILNKNKIKHIIAEIKSGTNLLPLCPLICVENNGQLQVADGQHRLEVCRQLGHQVYYVLRPALTLFEIAKMNSNTEKWTTRDYINCYATTGNQEYILLKQFTEKYKFPNSINLQLLTRGGTLTNGSGSQGIEQDFKQGKFVVKTLQEATKLADAVTLFSEFPSYTSRTFIIAISRIVAAGLVPITDVATAVHDYPSQLTVQESWKNYLTTLETIVNIGKKKRIIIHE